MTTSAKNCELPVFLGAGASTLGGYRTFLTFPHMFWPTSTEPPRLHATDKERVLLSAIRRELERKRRPLTLDNYLGILNDYHLVLQNVFSDEELRSRFTDSLLFLARIQELNQLVQRARAHICDLTVQHYKDRPRELYLGNLEEFYLKVLEKYNHVKIFTTNYDLVPEYLFERNRIAAAVKFFNGFRGFTNLRDAMQLSESQQPLVWSRDAYPSGQDGGSPKSVSLFRLHGCVAWYYPDDTDAGRSRDCSQSPLHLDLREPKEIRNYFSRLCVSYPGKDQYIGCDPHAFGFEQLYDTCFTCDRILFIGFAFRDIDVIPVIFNAIRQRNMLRLGVASSVRLVIVDPFIDRPQFLSRLKSLQENTAVPTESETGAIDIVPIRSEFPPVNSREVDAILRSLE